MRLTAGADVVDGTAGDDTIRGTIDTDTAANSTLNVSDFIDGGEGTDTLNLTTVGSTAATLPAAGIQNVENFFVRDVSTNATASIYNFNSIVGEEQVWADRATQDVDFQSLGTGTVVGVQGNGSTNLGDVDFNMATAADDVNIVLAGGLRGTPAITNTTSGAATAATLTSTGAANTVGAVTLADSGGTVETLNVVAESDLTANLVAADFATDATLNISGEGDVTLGGAVVTNIATVAAGEATGDLTLSVDDAKVTTGTGNDEVTLTAALTDGSDINLGAGDDVLLSSGGSVGNNVTVDGGAGRDTVGASLINAGNGGNFQNFEVLGLDHGSIATLDLNLLTGSTIESFELNNSAVTTIQGASIEQSLSVVGNSTGGATLDFADATGDADSYDISFDAATTGTVGSAATVGAGTVTLDGVENINVASGAEAGVNANSITLGADTAETVTITGDQALTVGFSSGFGANADGDEVTAIDASAATGDVSIDLANVTADAAGLTVTGGAGEDTITTNNFAVTVAGGAGDDTFDVNVSIGLSNAVSITDFEAGDTIDFSTLTTGSFNSTAVDVSAATTLEQAVELADGTSGNVSWFEYSSATYVVAAGAATTDASDDNVVQLAGGVDLSDATLTTGELTIA